MTATISKYNKPALFYGLSTLLPWTFWFLAGYVSHQPPDTNRNLEIASVLGFIGLLAPMGVAWGIISRDSDLKADIAHRFFNFQSTRPIFILLACFLMLGSILLAQAISLLFGYSASQFAITGHFTFSSGIFPVWFMLIIAPILEELAWHSYGTDCLRNRLNLFNTSLVFATFWGLWHVPLSTIRGYYQSNLVETGWIHGANFLVSIFPYVILMNWLYYKTGRNITVAIVFHITAGYFNEIFDTHPDSKIIQTALLILLAAAVILKEHRFFFMRAPASSEVQSSRPLEEKSDRPGSRENLHAPRSR
ncbi:MAG TPA: CPBP family intramembrane glutamic endopeptidase [Bacteroidota bacterium]|nr:CPBP family intramembrane glutamic endopeptidase [Bacteroidota bacterium]